LVILGSLTCVVIVSTLLSTRNTTSTPSPDKVSQSAQTRPDDSIASEKKLESNYSISAEYLDNLIETLQSSEPTKCINSIRPEDDMIIRPKTLTEMHSHLDDLERRINEFRKWNSKSPYEVVSIKSGLEDEVNRWVHSMDNMSSPYAYYPYRDLYESECNSDNSYAEWYGYTQSPEGSNYVPVIAADSDYVNLLRLMEEGTAREKSDLVEKGVAYLIEVNMRVVIVNKNNSFNFFQIKVLEGDQKWKRGWTSGKYILSDKLAGMIDKAVGTAK
jgi:hypothetical protein